MDIIFDIDGTLANAEHRLHHIIPDPNQLYEQPFRKDWDSFLSDEAVSKDTPIPQTFHLLDRLLSGRNHVLFITGRPEDQREVTVDWLLKHTTWPHAKFVSFSGYCYMRTNGDRRPSSVVKEELLYQAQMNGYNPTLVFEDRADDTAMWRRNGLLCCQVADGNY